jgi:hypothetical protein
MPVPDFTKPENWGMIEKFTSNDEVLSPDGIDAAALVPLVPLALVLVPVFDVLGEELQAAATTPTTASAMTTPGRCSRTPFRILCIFNPFYKLARIGGCATNPPIGHLTFAPETVIPSVTVR